MNKEAAHKIIKARIGLIKLQPFFGVLALRLKPVERLDLKPKTLATDGKSLFFHPDWVTEHPQDEVEAGVAHEVGHCALKHMGRRNGREPRRWNHACDFAVNAMLEDCGFTIPAGWLHDPAFKGMTAEHIYNLLPPMDDGDSDDSFDGHADDSAPDPVQEAEWEVATIQAAQTQRGKEAGNLPSSLQRFLDDLSAPKVDWRATLRRFATAACKGDYSWSRPNRAYLSLGLIMPGLYSEGVEDITTVIDTSGSVDNEMLKALGGEVADIRVTVQPKTSRVMYCDAAVNHVDEFEPDDQFEITPHGGGGTDFRPPFRWLEERDKLPTCLVYLTDGYGSFPKEPPPYPVLWVMTTDVQPPWGEVVRIEL